MPVGATEQRKVDVRMLAATNRDLTTMVAEGTFREDLYYRLHVVALRVPPLRERKDDIPILARHFLAQLAKQTGREKHLTRAAIEQLLVHDWPGNVRELENEMERVWVLSGDEDTIDAEHLTPHTARRPSAVPTVARSGPAASSKQSLPDAVEQLEKIMITERLAETGGNKTRAAEALGISRRNLIRKVRAYNLESVGRASRTGEEEDEET